VTYYSITGGECTKYTSESFAIGSEPFRVITTRCVPFAVTVTLPTEGGLFGGAVTLPVGAGAEVVEVLVGVVLVLTVVVVVVEAGLGGGGDVVPGGEGGLAGLTHGQFIVYLLYCTNKLYVTSVLNTKPRSGGFCGWLKS
jgi:hypothetical protein